MTSTNVFSGNFADKPSSRVLKPPGGGNSNIFGAPEDTPLPSACNKKAQTESQTPPIHDSTKSKSVDHNENVASKPESVKPEPEQKPDSATKSVTHTSIGGAGDSTKSYKTRMQGSFNPITGEPYAKVTNVVPGEPKPVSSISVRQPPGGASTKLW